MVCTCGTLYSFLALASGYKGSQRTSGPSPAQRLVLNILRGGYKGSSHDPGPVNNKDGDREFHIL